MLRGSFKIYHTKKDYAKDYNYIPSETEKELTETETEEEPSTDVE